MNKPVAWMGLTVKKEKRVSIGKLTNDDIPLYTHPVNACKHGVDDGACKECYLEATHPAELTDGEIQSISHQYHYTYNPDYVGFARAILRKAQEK